MKPLTTLINIVAFSALFVAYANVATPDRPAGVRRALQTYAGQMATGTWYAASDTLADAHALLAAPAQRAYEMAGISADDIDVAEIYNSFAIQEPLGVEALGFAVASEAQIADVSGEHPCVADHVVDRLAPGAECIRCHRREVVLAVDPLRDDERCGHDRLERGAVDIDVRIVGVQESPALQVDSGADLTWGDDERGVARQSPFGVHLRPVQ